MPRKLLNIPKIIRMFVQRLILKAACVLCACVIILKWICGQKTLVKFTFLLPDRDKNTQKP